MFDILQVSSLTFQLLRRLKWVFVSLAYYALFAMAGVKSMVLLLPLFLLAGLAYLKDKAREEQSMDDFSGDRLFFRYKNLEHFVTLPIPVSEKWSFEEASKYADTLRLSLAERIASRLPETLAQVLDKVVITDQRSGERKEFLRVCVRTRFGSLLTHFAHYASFGRTITAQYFTYVRGAHSDFDVMKFILLSPFTIWFWGGSWLLNRYSIIAQLSQFRVSSFEGIDLRTVYSLTNAVVFDETEKLLTEAGLITEAIMNVIQQTVYNNFGGTQVNNSRFRDVGHGVAAPRSLPKLRPA